MTERYEKKQKNLAFGLDLMNRREGGQKNEEGNDKPKWDDKVAVQNNVYKEKLISRLIRSDYGKDAHCNAVQDEQRNIIAMESKKSLEKLREIVKNGMQLFFSSFI